MRIIFALLVVLATAFPALAVNPSEMLPDPALEARARAISSELRCLVCQNQSIEDSDADLAAELRLIVRERITAGDSDEAVMQYVVDRYGEFVLLRPVIGWHTILLWGAAPALLLIGGAVVLIGALRRRKERVTEPSQTALSQEESAALARLEQKNADDTGPVSLTES